MFTKKFKITITRNITIPDGIKVEYNQGLVSVNSSNVTLQRRFSSPVVDISINQGNIQVTSKLKASKNTKRIINTMTAHIKNMINGIQSPYIYKLKIISGHFPINVTLDKNIILIKNFLGEKVPRKAKILDGVKAEIKGDEITITSINKELAGQTAGNIEMATRITNKDRRIFSDGIFITQKADKRIQ